MISKSGKLYYTEEEKARAYENSSALEYALNHGYNLVKVGSSYQHPEHDSMVFTKDGKWYWNSRGLKGDAFDFIQHFEQRSYLEAVLILAGTYYSPMQARSSRQIPQEEKKKLEIPPHAPDNKKVIQYLTQERGIDLDVVTACIRNGSVYQSAVPAKFGTIHNLVMVGFDSEHHPRYISSRSISGRKFRVDATGSDKSYAFIIPSADGMETNGVVLVESPIEAMSYFCLARTYRSPNLHYDIIAAGGATSRVALERYLVHHPNIRTIVSALNNDETVTEKTIRLLDDYAALADSPFQQQWKKSRETFPAAIDVLLRQLRETGSEEWKKPLLQYLSQDSHSRLDKETADSLMKVISPIIQAWPQDTIHHRVNAGLAGLQKIQELYNDKYRITQHKPSKNDWNDVLRDSKSHTVQRELPAKQKGGHTHPER